MAKAPLTFLVRMQTLLTKTLGGRRRGADNRYWLDTKYGPLAVSVTPCAGKGVGTVFGRFRYAVAARRLNTGCSGKWNHHYLGDWRLDDALHDIEAQLRRIRPTTLEEFNAIAAPLILELAVQCAVEAWLSSDDGCPPLLLEDPPWAAATPRGRLSHDAGKAWFIRHAIRRVLFMYDVNPQIRDLLLAPGDSGRDTAYAFVAHWLDAYIEDPVQYRAQHTLCIEDLSA